MLNSKLKCDGDGYTELVDRFNSIVQNNNKIFFSGAFGVGKTTFLDNWEERFCKKQKFSKNKKVVYEGTKYRLVKINAYSDFYSDSFIEVLENKVFGSWRLFWRMNWIPIILILSIIIPLFVVKTINVTSDIFSIVISALMLLIAYNQHKRSTVLESRSKLIAERCKKKSHIFIIDDFDRVSYSEDGNNNTGNLSSSQKEQILKIMSLVDTSKNKIIFVGDINSNNMNFLEKYYDYIYEYPVHFITNEVKTLFLEIIHEKVLDRRNKYDLDLFKQFADFYKVNDKYTTIRDMIRILNHIESVDLKRVNISEVIISHYLYYQQREDYNKIFGLLLDYKGDYLRGDEYYTRLKQIEFKGHSPTYNKKLKKLLLDWLDIESMRETKLIPITPPGSRREFHTCSEIPELYLVNQFDNVQYTYDEFCKKLLDIKYWKEISNKSNRVIQFDNTNMYFNTNRFFEKLKNDGMLSKTVIFLIDNITRMSNIDEYRTFFDAINEMSNWNKEANYPHLYDDFDSIITINAWSYGKVVYICQLLLVNKLPEEKLNEVVNFFKEQLVKIHQEQVPFFCEGWFGLLFYTNYAKYIDKEIAIDHWENRQNLNQEIRKYFFKGDRLASGYFRIGEPEYDKFIDNILMNTSGVPEAIEEQRRIEYRE